MSEPLKNDGAWEFTPFVYTPVNLDHLEAELKSGGFSFGTSWFGDPHEVIKPQPPKTETWRDRPPLL